MRRLRDIAADAIASSDLLTAFRQQFIRDGVARIAEKIELPEPTSDDQALSRAVLFFESIKLLRQWSELLSLGRARFDDARSFAFVADNAAERLWVAAARFSTDVILTSAAIVGVSSDVLKERGFTLPNVPKCKSCDHDMILHKCAIRTEAAATHSCVLCPCDVQVPVVKNDPGVKTETREWGTAQVAAVRLPIGDDVPIANVPPHLHKYREAESYQSADNSRTDQGRESPSDK